MQQLMNAPLGNLKSLQAVDACVQSMRQKADRGYFDPHTRKTYLAASCLQLVDFLAQLKSLSWHWNHEDPAAH